MQFLKYALIIGAFIVFSDKAHGQELDVKQIELIQDSATRICNTVKEAKGVKTNVEIQGGVEAKISGLLRRLGILGGELRGTYSAEKFDGLTRDATATAMEGDRQCRERVFKMMLGKLTLSRNEGYLWSSHGQAAAKARQTAVVHDDAIRTEVVGNNNSTAVIYGNNNTVSQSADKADKVRIHELRLHAERERDEVIQLWPDANEISDYISGSNLMQRGSELELKGNDSESANLYLSAGMLFSMAKGPAMMKRGERMQEFVAKFSAAKQSYETTEREILSLIKKLPKNEASDAIRRDLLEIATHANSVNVQPAKLVGGFAGIEIDYNLILKLEGYEKAMRDVASRIGNDGFTIGERRM